MIDDSVTKFVCQSVCCGSRKCKTCNHLVEGNTFTRNVHELWDKECYLFDIL